MVSKIIFDHLQIRHYDLCDRYEMHPINRIQPREARFNVKGSEQVLFALAGGLLTALRTVAPDSTAVQANQNLKCQWACPR